MSEPKFMVDSLAESKGELVRQGWILHLYLTDAEVSVYLLKAEQASGEIGFMGQYHYMMRLLDAYLALNGALLTAKSPHYAAGFVLANLFPEKTREIRELGPTRHALKYSRTPATEPDSITLNRVIHRLEYLVKLAVANRLQVPR